MKLLKKFFLNKVNLYKYHILGRGRYITITPENAPLELTNTKNQIKIFNKDLVFKNHYVFVYILKKFSTKHI